MYIDLVDVNGTLIKHLGWDDELTDAQVEDELLAIAIYSERTKSDLRT